MKIKYCIIALAASLLLAAVSCQQVELDEDSIQSSMSQTKAADKIIGSSKDANNSVILVKLDITPTADLSFEGVRSITRLFPSTPGKEELEARFEMDKWYEVLLEDGVDVNTVAETLSLQDYVSTIEYDMHMTKASDCIVHPYGGPSPETKADNSIFNDPSLTDQWHYINRGNSSIASSAKLGADINVERVWADLTAGDPSIIIAVVDEGVKYSHSDLRDNMWINTKEIAGNGVDDDGNGYVDDVYGYNFCDNGPITWAISGDTGHGTHVAGTIAAVNNNSQGVCGVAGGSGKKDGCRIMSCQIFSGDGGGGVSEVAKAVKYAADMGASIISCSFGYQPGAFTTDANYEKRAGAELTAIRYFEATKNNSVVDGGIPIFATGNDGKPYATYPGAYHDIISVSAFGPDYLPTYYTNYGPGCNVTAPGGEAELRPWTHYKALVLSTVPSELSETSETKNQTGLDYGYMQGTSMATPHVSGVVALGLSYAKKLGKTYDSKTFKEMVIASTNDFESQLNSTSAKKDYKTSRTLNLANYRKMMGSGSIDAWLLCMKIEGIPSIIIENGKNQWVDMSSYFGTSATNLVYMQKIDGEWKEIDPEEKAYVEISDADRAALGLAEDPYVQFGKLFIHPTKVGAAKICVTAVGGGTKLGGGDRPTGGMEISQEISLISRSFKSTNGGWL